MRTRYRLSIIVLVIALAFGISVPSQGNDTTKTPLVRINCRLSGKFFVGEHYLGEVKAGFQYPVNDLKPGHYIVKIVGENETWEDTIDVTSDNPVVVEALVVKKEPVKPPVVIAPPTPPVVPPSVVTTPIPPKPTVVKPPLKPPVVVTKPPKKPPIEPDRSKMIADLKLKLAYIRPGSFKMGDESGRPYEKPVHTVNLTKEFWMGTTEVTATQFKAILPRFRVNGSKDDQPVVNVSWWEAMDFCNVLTAREVGKIPEGYQYRLPTEAEWEYCCRAGSTERYFTGANPEDMTPYAVKGRSVENVAGKKANAWGLYDMIGNVQEWCLDGIPSRPRGTPKTYVEGIDDPIEMKGTARVLRGGHYASGLPDQYSSCRKPYYPVRTYRAIGFRIVLAPTMAEPSEGQRPRRRYK